VEEEAWQIAAINEALAEFQTGGAILSPHDEVMQRMEETIRVRTSDAGPLA
jgi:hypothetical protein